MATDDLEIFAQWRNGERLAGDELARRYDQPLTKFFHDKVRPDEADDLKQQVWVALATADPGRIHTGFRGYLFGISRNLLYRHLGQRHRAEWDPNVTALRYLDPTLTTEVAQRLGAQDLRVRLQQLPLAVQVLLELRYVQDLSTTELAVIYEVPVGTIKRRLWQARRDLEELLPPGAQNLLHR